MKLPQAMEQFATGQRQFDLAQTMTLMEVRAGGKQKAARMVGVSPVTWRRWRREGGQRPSRRSMDLLSRARVRPDRVGSLRSGDFSITGVILVSNETEMTRPERTIGASGAFRSELPAASRGEVADRVAAADYDTAATRLMEAIDNDYVPGMRIVDVSHMEVI